jgi:hypothetical protein
MNKALVLGGIVMMAHKAKALTRGDVVCEIINVKRGCWIKIKLRNRLVEDGFVRLHAFGFMGVDAATEEIQDGEFREEPLLVQAIRIGKEIQWSLAVKRLNELNHRQILGENVTPDFDKVLA